MPRKMHDVPAEEERPDPYDDDGEFDNDDGGPVGARIDRDAHRAHMAEMRDVAIRLSRIAAKIRHALPLGPELQTALDNLVDAEMRPDRRRHMMRVRLLLTEVDPKIVEAALRGETEATQRDAACARFRKKLIEGTDADIQAFMTAYPQADRQAIRTAAREAKATSPAGARAFTRLFQLLRDGMIASEAGARETEARDDEGWDEEDAEA